MPTNEEITGGQSGASIPKLNMAINYNLRLEQFLSWVLMAPRGLAYNNGSFSNLSHLYAFSTQNDERKCLTGVENL